MKSVGEKGAVHGQKGAVWVGWCERNNKKEKSQMKVSVCTRTNRGPPG